MNRRVGKIKRVTIKQKLICYCYLIVTPILLFISAILFYFNYKDNIESRRESVIQSLQSLSDSIEVLQSGMIEFVNYMSINEDIGRILKSADVERLNEDTLLWRNNSSIEMLEDMMSLKNCIKTISIYPENGVNPYLRCMDASAYIPSLKGVQNQNLYKEAVDAKGKILFTRANKSASSVYIANQFDKIVLYRELYDLSKKKKLAYIALGADARAYDNLAKGAIQSEDQGVIVFSREGNEIIRQGAINDGVVEYLSDVLFVNENSNIKEIESYSYRGLEIYAVQNKTTGTIVVKTMSQYNVKNQMKNIAMTPLLLLIGVLVGLAPVVITVSNVITKPLRKIEIAMDKFKQGDFSQQLEISTTDELGEVARCFNGMVKDIDALIHQNYVMRIKEQESELTALQAQINPHFLYNTLDSLYWQAETAGNEEIAENILALSQLFRMVLGQGKGEIAVENEIELIRNYLAIQKMRFSKRLEYVIDVDDAILDCIIPKLILQPFVENSIVHGFESGGKDYCLSISGFVEDGYIVFIVADTGIGMTEEQLKAVLSATEKEGKSMRIGRYAIKNVNERLSIKYKHDFALHIESEYGKGTTVTIKIPLKR